MSLLDDVGGVFAGLGDLAAPATLTRTVPGAYDPVTGTNGASTVTNCSVKAVLDGASQKSLGSKFGEGLVQGGDLQADDVLTVNGWGYAVIAVRPTFAGSVAVLLSILVRK